MIKFKIKDVRKEKRMTQLELAKKSNVSQSYISALETNTNKTSPSLDILESIAKALDICVKDLLDCTCKK